MRLYVVQAYFVSILQNLCRNDGENSIVLKKNFCWLFYVNIKERESVFEVADDYDKRGTKET